MLYKITKYFYTFFLYITLPLVLFRLFWKSRRIPGYRKRILERFGLFKAPIKKGGLWLHAVSVGESIAAIPIIHEFQKHYPDKAITITTTTPTGSERVKTVFGDQVFHVYCPYDLPCFIKSFLKRVKPEVAVLMETEIWPNLLEQCKKKSIPIMIANGRLSPRSMKGFSRFPQIIKKVLENISYVAAQSKQDGERFIRLGLSANKLSISGNIKFDVFFPDSVREAAIALRAKIGKDRPIWVAASTHAGEEEPILTAFRQVQKSFPDILLILVPRHPNRFASVIHLLQKHAYSFVTRSSGLPVIDKTEIFLGDSMGEMGIFYGASDIAFVGGSLVPIGGHNTLEPASLAVPVITGPNNHNFVAITDLLLRAGALVQIDSSKGLAKALLNWFSHKEKRRQAGFAGKKVVDENRGAAEKIFSVIQKMLKK